MVARAALAHWLEDNKSCVDAATQVCNNFFDIVNPALGKITYRQNACL